MPSRPLLIDDGFLTHQHVDPKKNQHCEDKQQNDRGRRTEAVFVEDPDLLSDDELIEDDSLDLEGTEEFDIDAAMKIDADDDEL